MYFYVLSCILWHPQCQLLMQKWAILKKFNSCHLPIKISPKGSTLGNDNSRYFIVRILFLFFKLKIITSSLIRLWAIWLVWNQIRATRKQKKSCDFSKKSIFFFFFFFFFFFLKDHNFLTICPGKLFFVSFSQNFVYILFCVIHFSSTMHRKATNHGYMIFISFFNQFSGLRGKNLVT